MRLRFRSVRSQLIATTMVTFGIVLAGSTFTTYLIYRHAVLNSIDDYLRKQSIDLARFAARRTWSPRGGGRGRLDNAPDDRPHSPPTPHVPDGTSPSFLPVGDVPPSMNISKMAYDMPGYRLAATGKPVLHTIFFAGELRRVISQPSVDDGQIRGVVQVPYGLGTTLKGLDDSEGLLMRLIVPLGFLLVGVASYAVVYRLLTPLRRMTSEADRIGQDNFSERLEPLGADEFAALAGTLNGMLDRLEQQYEIEKQTSERLKQAVERQRRFTSDASHELKTPLTVFLAHLGVLRRSDKPSRDEVESLDDMELAGKRMSALLEDLLLLARNDAGILKPRVLCSLNEIVERAVASVHGAAGLTTVSADSEYLIDASPGELAHVFTNLIENAIKHSESREPISIRLARDEAGVSVVVEDFGIGIDAKHLPYIFERFYRADESRTSETGGSGLGLAIAEQLVVSNGGSIRVESELGKGTRFIIHFPSA